MAGAGSVTPINDINRLVATYGGSPQDWAKMTSKHIIFKEGLVLSSGTKIQIHYYKNVKTGQIVDTKPVLANTKKGSK